MKDLHQCCVLQSSICNKCRNIFVCPFNSTQGSKIYRKECALYEELPNPFDDYVNLQTTRSENPIENENKTEAPELVEKEQAEIEDINLMHEVNEYLSTEGFSFLSVTENISSDKTAITWIIYENKQEIGKFSTVNQPCRILIQTVANTAINIYIDSQKPKSWIEERNDIICPHCGYVFSDEIRLMGHGKELQLNFCPVCGKEVDDSKR